MANPYVVLAAVGYASNADITALRQLASRPDALKLDLTLRIILTYLPEGTEPELYVDFLRELSTSSTRQNDAYSALPSEQEISEEKARIRVRRLRLAPLIDPKAQYVSYADPDDPYADPLTLFLLRHAHRIDAETGSLVLVSQLLGPFIDHSDILRSWMISTLLPLLRHDYEYYPLSGPSHSLEDFEGLDGSIAIQSLLSKAAQRNDQIETREVGRDLRGLVGPWMYGENSRKRRKLSHGNRRKNSLGAGRVPVLGGDDARTEERQCSDWVHVNEWLLDLGLRGFSRAVDAMIQWDGPRDVDYGDWGRLNEEVDEEEGRDLTKRYAQAGMGALYATNESSLETIIGSHRILLHVAKLVELEEPPDHKRSDTVVDSGLSGEYFDSLSQAHLLHDALLRSQNPFTIPTDSAVCFFNLVLASCYKLLNLGNIKTSRSVAELALFGTEADQVSELKKTLYTLKTEKMDENLWASIRRQILWLRNWEQHYKGEEKPRGVFSKIENADLENELLRAMLEGGCYTLAEEVYCKQAQPPLPMATVESTVLGAALSSYDAASNGNRTRGGVRKASEIIKTFQTYFPNSIPFAQTTALLSATHAMSFYSLTLQHGVPFQPVNIRAHKDPMSLIGKIISQNPRSYTHLDDLLEMGQNLVAAGLTEDVQDPSTTSSKLDSEQQALIARRRITRMAIEASLAVDDFDTAYSYVVNRLSSDDQAKTSHPLTLQDDISWRAAYQAGRYRTRESGSPALRRLEQRMELLSQALLLAPPSALPEVLTVWQQCEQEVNAQIAKEAEEEQRWDEKGDNRVPGGFAADSSLVVQKSRDPTRSAPVEEAPIGLFEVARGAAAALSKNAFPLRGQKREIASSTKASRERPLSGISNESSDDGSAAGATGSGRVRKRDMVSSMVAGGLASGIGWVIGEGIYRMPK